MTTETHTPQLAPAGVLEAARDSVVDLGQQLWAAKPKTELLAAKAAIERLRSSLAALDAKVCLEIEATGAAQDEGWSSATAFLTSISGGRHGAGTRALRLARELEGDRQLTADALAAAIISPDHAQVIVEAIRKLPASTTLRDRAEVLLLEKAQVFNASELDTAAQHVLEQIDPDGTERREEAALDRLERSAHLDRFLAIKRDGLGGVHLKGRGTVEDAAILETALSSLAGPHPAGDPTSEYGTSDPDCGLDGKDTRDHGTRMWDALIDVGHRVLDAEVLPEDHGHKPRVAVTVDLDTLQDQVGTATLDTGDEISPETARRLACDADILPAVLGGKSAVFDTALTQRLVTTSLWLVLVLRDRHCAFPGCRQRPIACDAHHIKHWAHGGLTALLNLVLLCRAHHKVIHHTPWQVRLNPHDGHPEFLPPPGRHRLTPHYRDSLEPTGPPGTDGETWIRERTARS